MERQRGSMGLCKHIASALRLSLELSLYGLVLLAPVLYVGFLDVVKFQVFRKEDDTPALQAGLLYEVNYFEKERVVFLNETLDGRFLHITSGILQSWGILTLYFPIAAKLYLGALLPNRIIALVVVSSFVFLLFLYSALGLPILAFFFACMLLVLALALHLQLPKGTKVPWFLFEHTITMAVGVLVSIHTRRFFDENIPWQTLFRFCVIYPLVREIGRFVAARSSWYLTSDAQVMIGNYGNVRREYGWVFSVYLYLFCAIFARLEVANLKGVKQKTLLILFQNILEIAMRTTIMKRDDMLQRIFRCHEKSGLKRQGTMVMPTPDSFTRSASQIKMEARRSLYSMLIILEMISEYVAIFASTFVLVYYRDKILFHPYPVYANAPGVFRTLPHYDGFLLSGVLQLFAEIIVDTVCVTVESKSGLDLVAAWRRRPMHFTLIMILSVWFSFLLADGAVSTFRDDLSGCFGFDMCECMGKGLSVGGVRENYCLFLNSSLSF